MAKLGERVLGEFQLGGAAVIAESAPILAASAPQDNSFSRVLEDDEVIMRNTFISPVFDGTQNLVRAGELVTRDSISVFDKTSNIGSAGDVFLSEAFPVIESAVISASDGSVAQVSLSVFGEGASRQIFTDAALLRQIQIFSDVFSFTSDTENQVLRESLIQDDSFSRTDDGNTVIPLVSALNDSFSRLIDGDVTLSQSLEFGNTFTRTFEEDEIIMSNTFFAPVFDGTQNLVRSGDTIDSTAGEFDATLRIVTGESVLAESLVEFFETDKTSFDGDTVIIQSVELEPEYSFIANPGVVTRELGAGSPQLGGSQIGLFQLGLGEGTDGTILRADTLTFRTAIGDIVSRAGTVVGKGLSRKFVDALIASALAEPAIEKSIGRKFDGDVVQIDFEEFVEVFTRTFDGRTATALASQIEAFRILTEWALGQRQLGTTIEETREWQLLEVTIRYDERNEQDVRNILNKSGKANILEDPSGGFKTIDTGVNDDIGLNAPTDREKLRTVDTWYLDDYDKELVNRDGTVYDVTFELIPQIEKSFDNEYGSFESEPTDTQQTSLWYFDFEFGSFATNRVSIATEEVGDGTTDVIEMNLILKEDEARIIEENASYLNTVFLREIPDNADRLDDTSEDTRQTVDITPPNGRDEPIPADSYVIRTWETEWTGNVFNVAMEVGRE